MARRVHDRPAHARTHATAAARTARRAPRSKRPRGPSRPSSIGPGYPVPQPRSGDAARRRACGHPLAVDRRRSTFRSVRTPAAPSAAHRVAPSRWSTVLRSVSTVRMFRPIRVAPSRSSFRPAVDEVLVLHDEVPQAVGLASIRLALVHRSVHRHLVFTEPLAHRPVDKRCAHRTFRTSGRAGVSTRPTSPGRRHGRRTGSARPPHARRRAAPARLDAGYDRRAASGGPRCMRV